MFILETKFAIYNLATTICSSPSLKSRPLLRNAEIRIDSLPDYANPPLINSRTLRNATWCWYRFVCLILISNLFSRDELDPIWGWIEKFISAYVAIEDLLDLEKRSWKKILKKSSWKKILKKDLEKRSWKKILKKALEKNLEKRSWTKILKKYLEKKSWKKILKKPYTFTTRPSIHRR